MVNVLETGRGETAQNSPTVKKARRDVSLPSAVLNYIAAAEGVAIPGAQRHFKGAALIEDEANPAYRDDFPTLDQKIGTGMHIDIGLTRMVNVYQRSRSNGRSSKR